MHAMKHPATMLLSLTSLILSLACRVSEPAPAPAGVLVSDPDGCRSFASLGSVSLGDTSGQQRCRFDPLSAEHRCELEAGAARVTSVAEYASLADFVEAGRALGKVTSLAESRLENGQRRHISHRYDELGRLVQSLEEDPGGTTRTTFADYDAQGRPRRASLESAGQREPCIVRVSIEYKDAARTVLRRSRPAEPERCGFAEQTLIERYDLAGNRVSVEAADGAGVELLFAAQRATATERVCL